VYGRGYYNNGNYYANEGGSTGGDGWWWWYPSWLNLYPYVYEYPNTEEVVYVVPPEYPYYYY
jgi:hypothetical protein